MTLRAHKNRFKLEAATKARLIVLLILLCILFLLGYRNGAVRLYHINRDYNDVLEENRFYKHRIHELEEKKDKLLNDEKYIERQAREKHNMVLPGEKVYKVIKEN